jgi:CheY-like chemotaxis protein
LSSSNSVLLIAHDTAMRRSLAFALEVEGYVVNAQDNWSKAHQILPLAACAVIDDAMCREQRETGDMPLPVILLGSPDGLQLPKGAVVLSKPLRMPELLSALRSIP